MPQLRFSSASAAAIISLAIASLTWFTIAVNEASLESTLVGDFVEAREVEIVSSTPHEYVEVVEGCGSHYEGECARTFAGPGEEFRPVTRLRKGVVLKVESVMSDLRTWYKVVHEEVRYPERLARSEYLPAENARHFYGNGIEEFPGNASSTKRIVVDRSLQRLYAYEGEDLFMEVVISTGLDITPTPRGIFTVYKKTPTRYMQGPLPGVSDQYYDLPGVPWNLYFTEEGGVIHGAYWHNGFGRKWSHGCVNVPLAEARTLYEWAEIGIPVVVRD